MAGLFHFWSCLLQDHFNAGMFKDFQAAAWRQSEQSHTEGLNSLFAFYSYGLEKTFRPSVYQAFEQDALKVSSSCCMPDRERKLLPSFGNLLLLF